MTELELDFFRKMYIAYGKEVGYWDFWRELSTVDYNLMYPDNSLTYDIDEMTYIFTDEFIDKLFGG